MWHEYRVQPEPIVTLLPMKQLAGMPVGKAAAVWITQLSPTELKVPILRQMKKFSTLMVINLLHSVDIATDDAVVPNGGPFADHDFSDYYLQSKKFRQQLELFLPMVELGATQQFSVRGRKS